MSRLATSSMHRAIWAMMWSNCSLAVMEGGGGRGGGDVVVLLLCWWCPPLLTVTLRE